MSKYYFEYILNSNSKRKIFVHFSSFNWNDLQIYANGEDVHCKHLLVDGPTPRETACKGEVTSLKFTVCQWFHGNALYLSIKPEEWLRQCVFSYLRNSYPI